MKNNIELVLLGDSIIKRGDWKKLLSKKELINLGIDGDGTKDVLLRISNAIQINPKTLFLMIGINDLCISIPLDEVFETYKKILLQLKKSSINIIVNAVFITQMPSVNKKVKKFNLLLEEYCKKEDITFLDLNNHFVNKKGLLKEELTTDGLHLGQNAYKAWAYKLKEFL